MAVYAAHLTRTLQGTPSIFDVSAQEALGATVKPALSKVVEYLAAVYPNKFGWCVRWFDELYLLFDCCVQYHYLKHYAASFSETFYGLIRIPVVTNDEFSSGQRLPDVLEKLSLALLVFVPYLRGKAERLIEKWREDEEDGKLGKDISSQVRRAAIRVYATVHMSCEVWRLVQYARYVSGGSASPAPALALLGLKLGLAPPRDHPDFTWKEFLRSLVTGDVGSAVLTFPMLGSLALRVVEYGAFAVQMLRWWESQAAVDTSALVTPPPPERDQKSLRWKNKCPICLQTWKIPTVLPVSGYIFCYVCISRHVRSAGACPATRLPATPDSLIRLYID